MLVLCLLAACASPPQIPNYEFREIDYGLYELRPDGTEQLVSESLTLPCDAAVRFGVRAQVIPMSSETFELPIRVEIALQIDSPDPLYKILPESPIVIPGGARQMGMPVINNWDPVADLPESSAKDRGFIRIRYFDTKSNEVLAEKVFRVSCEGVAV